MPLEGSQLGEGNNKILKAPKAPQYSWLECGGTISLNGPFYYIK